MSTFSGILLELTEWTANTDLATGLVKVFKLLHCCINQVFVYVTMLCCRDIQLCAAAAITSKVNSIMGNRDCGRAVQKLHSINKMIVNLLPVAMLCCI